MSPLGSSIGIVRKGIIKLTYKCNNRCLFCRALPLAERRESLSTNDAMKKLVMAKKLGIKVVLFSGGEPTLVRDLHKLIGATRTLGMDYGLVTNARRLAYPRYFKRLVKTGPVYVHTSILGSNSATHNELTRADSFDDLMRALKNMRAANIPDINVNTVITALNVSQLREITDLLHEFTPITYKMTLMEPKGLYESNSERISISPLDAAKAAIDALNYGLSKYGDSGLKIGIEGFPLCMIKGYESFVENMMTQGILYMSEVDEDRFFPVDHGERQYFHACHLCSRKLECPGQFSAYGSDGLTPFTDQVPLAYPMLMKAGDLVGEPSGNTECPVFQWTRTRGLKERNGLCMKGKERTDYYALEDGHADGLRVQVLKSQGQVFLDQREQAGPGIPVKVPVQLDKTCENCDIQYACPGVFRRVHLGRYYKLLDQKVIQLLKEISGRVVDLGCSRSYYTPVLMDMLREGRITYTGVDLHGSTDLPEAVEQGAIFLRVAPEQLEMVANSLDWVLILDSINGFVNPLTILSRAKKWLVDSGRVMVVGRNPFLLLTTQQKNTWGLGARHRTSTMSEVVHWLDECGFVPQQVAKPKAGRTNLWYVTAKKAD